MAEIFKFGSGEKITQKQKKRPWRCPKCGRVAETVLVGRHGVRGWMCRECKARFKQYMVDFSIKAASIVDTDAMWRQKPRYKYRIYETDAVRLAGSVGT